MLKLILKKLTYIKSFYIKIYNNKIDKIFIFKNYLNKKYDYKRIDEIEKNIEDGIEIYQNKPRTDKNKKIINNSNKIIKAIELFKSLINNDEIIIPEEYTVKPNNNVDLDWMHDKDGYEETAEGVDTKYMKEENNNELKLIKDFITKINNGTINNKNKAGNEFRKLKQKVTNYFINVWRRYY